MHWNGSLFIGIRLDKVKAKLAYSIPWRASVHTELMRCNALYGWCIKQAALQRITCAYIMLVRYKQLLVSSLCCQCQVWTWPSFPLTYLYTVLRWPSVAWYVLFGCTNFCFCAWQLPCFIWLCQGQYGNSRWWTAFHFWGSSTVFSY